ncbi:dorsal-ventral patterning protein Sog-like, partial [Nilaparvata lugens]
PDIVDDPTTVVSGDDEKNTKHFAALLTNRNQLDSADIMMYSASGSFKQYSATGRFSFHKRNLYYSFYTSTSLRPRGLQFVDLKGNILEEQVLPAGSVYQNKTGKICGVWRRIPREYRRLIRDEKLLVNLLWDKAELTITGQLYRYRALTTELYSILLEGTNEDPTTLQQAGTALVSVSTTAPSLHLTVIFTGIFTNDEIQSGKEGTISVKLTSLDGKTVVFDETMKVEKPSSDLNTVEVRSAVSHQDLHLLSNLQLQLAISNHRQPALAVSGVARPRTTCDVYVGTVVGERSEAAGLAWVYVNRQAALDYHVQLDGLGQQLSKEVQLSL